MWKVSEMERNEKGKGERGKIIKERRRMPEDGDKQEKKRRMDFVDFGEKGGSRKLEHNLHFLRSAL